MNKKLYVGNLPYEITEDELKGLFEEIGPVESVAIITDKYSGRSKGFGFVEMETEEAATEAIEKVNGKEVGPEDRKRALVVNEARPPKPRGDRGGSFGGGGSRY